jgi:hypothetical protein
LVGELGLRYEVGRRDSRLGLDGRVSVGKEGGIFTSSLGKPYLEGGLLVSFCRFSPIWVDFVNFRQPFFPFLSFFQLRVTVYSQTDLDPVL